ncbi:uncharacterized protein LOC134839460 isoform X2 [Symsagittifera roscoffensis]|uniref:uncharacterized protein LOC134839460 isoform X2 n=1 Tax=Symsagittifera roscoffensis TaxID=84072 RepID=UPI00307BB123
MTAGHVQQQSSAMVLGGMRARDATSEFDFFRKSHLSISRLPTISGTENHLDRSHSYWRVQQQICAEAENVRLAEDPPMRGVSRITTKRQNKTLYGGYPKQPEAKHVKPTPKTAAAAAKLPSMDSKLGAKSVFWRWNSLSEDLRRGRVLNFHQLKIKPPKQNSTQSGQGGQNLEASGGQKGGGQNRRWDRASSRYHYRVSPRYHVQFLEDIHQTRTLGWKGNTKMVNSAKRDSKAANQKQMGYDGTDFEEEEGEEGERDEFEDALATNISGVDEAGEKEGAKKEGEEKAEEIGGEDANSLEAELDKEMVNEKDKEDKKEDDEVAQTQKVLTEIQEEEEKD